MEQLHLAPQNVKSTKPPSHRGGRVVSGDAYHRERGRGNERKGGARAMQKLNILGICEHQDRRASRSLLLCGTDGRAHSRVSTSQRISCLAGTADWCFVCCTKKLAADQSESTAHGRNRGGQSSIEASG